MRVAIRNRKEFAAGVLFSSIRVCVAILARNHTFGTATSIGPGYFPFCLALVLIGLGVASIVRSARSSITISIGKLLLTAI